MKRGWRILLLLVILFATAATTLGERLWVRSWSRPLDVAIYPIGADAAGAAYVAHLRAEDFQEIGAFLSAQGQRWRHRLTPVPRVVLHAAIHDLPPLGEPRSAWQAVALSLRLRWYAFRHTPFWGSFGRVRLFLLYHEATPGEILPDSHGMQKGLLGVVHLFASDDQRAQNNIVIAHELLHTLGASDKYDSAGRPVYPTGFADSTAEPRYPQSKAEIMAGRIALSADRTEMPESLKDVVVGYATAAEIGW
jgi:hypothetical protein